MTNDLPPTVHCRTSGLHLLTSSFMPVSSSIMTQASMGRATSLPLLFRCSSSPVPNAGFSVHESEREEKKQREHSHFFLLLNCNDGSRKQGAKKQNTTGWTCGWLIWRAARRISSDAERLWTSRCCRRRPWSGRQVSGSAALSLFTLCLCVSLGPGGQFISGTQAAAT